jgi:hypothetical protein
MSEPVKDHAFVAYRRNDGSWGEACRFFRAEPDRFCGRYAADHAFVEPPAEAACLVCDRLGPMACSDHPAAPAPDAGARSRYYAPPSKERQELRREAAPDEAAAIADHVWAKAGFKPSTRNAIEEAAAAGIAAGRKAAFGEAEKLLRSRADVAYLVSDTAAPKVRTALHRAADTIASRARKETK